MKRIILSTFCIIALFLGAQAQSPAASVVKHSRDFFVLSFTYDSWPGVPDSIRTGGFSHGFNFAFTYDFPLNDDSHFSVAPGLGISASHIAFKNQTLDLGGPTSTLNFNKDSIYKSYHLINTFVEIPIELRYRSYSGNANKGFKAAIGLKFGALMDAKTKGKRVLRGNKQIDKLKNKYYFEKWRVAGTLRVGYSNFAVYASYSLTPLLTQTAGPKINPLSLGIAISGF